MKKVLSLVLLGLLLGAGVTYAAYQYRASVSMRGEIVATTTPGLAITPGIVDFAGMVPGAKSPVRTLEITNAGDITLTRIRFNATGLPTGVIFLVSYSPETPVIPGGKWTVWVQLDIAASVAPQVLSGEIVIEAE